MESNVKDMNPANPANLGAHESQVPDFEIKRKRRKAVIAGTIGNVLEWYDYSIYGYMAPVIGALFFPSSDPIATLLITFAVFALGFLMRPLGAVILGPYGDRVGRKKALSIAIILMGGATLMIGVLPTYQQIGIMAPILLVLARLLQGFSTGGEWGSGTAFIVEYASPGRRGLTGSWQQFSTGAGLLLGSLTATIITSTVSGEALSAWGWRIPFLLGILVAGVGFYLRWQIEETPKFQTIAKEEVASTPLLDSIKNHPKQILKAFGFAMHWAASYYLLLTYMPTYVSKVIKLPLSLALLSNVIVLLFFIAIVPLMGYLSDRIGRKPLLLASTIGFAVFSYPIFAMMSGGGFAIIVLSQMILAVFVACFSGPGPAAISELFPTKVRASALSIGYNLSTAIFGGTAPFVATYLIKVTGNNFSPTFYVICLSLVTMLVVIGTKETYKDPLQ
jgi:MHS family proline/betaine transporter-like MFS transporter